MKTLDKLGSKASLEVVGAESDGAQSPPSLTSYLKELPPGPIQTSAPVIRLLVEAWDGLEGSSDGGMRWDKLAGRCESLAWDPPLLSFVIERHGAIVNGSSRAELQYWSVDPESGRAWISKKGRRQLYPMSKRLNVIPLAERVASEIESGTKSEYLNWFADGSVRVRVGKIIPETYAQTTVSRRRRFRDALVNTMASRGWQEIRLHIYKKGS